MSRKPANRGRSGGGAGASPAHVVATLAEAKQSEGQRVVARGRLLVPEQGKGLCKLLLGDGTRIAIGHFSDEAEPQVAGFEGLGGRPVTIEGRIHLGDIPERYGIYARIGGPYLVDIVRIAEDEAAGR